MKQRIKFLFLATIITLVSVATVNAQLGVQAGYVNSRFVSGENSTDPYNGFEAGLTYDMQIQGGFALQYGLLYTMIADKESQELPLIGTMSVVSRGHYLNIPFRAAYYFPVGDSFKVFVYGGPNFTFGLGGVNKVTSSMAGNESADVKWYGTDGMNYNRFDVKLGAGLGVQFANIVLKGGYDWGLLNTVNTDNVTINRNQFNVSLGYQF